MNVFKRAVLLNTRNYYMFKLNYFRFSSNNYILYFKSS